MKQLSTLHKPYQFSNDVRVSYIGPVPFEISIRYMLDEILEMFSDRLPENRQSHILLKPNCNNDLSALFGNATDLRILRELIVALKHRGYRNITIADGPNIGTYRKGVDVFERLGIRKLAKLHDVRLADLNKCTAVPIKLVTDQIAVPQIFLSADCIINLPKVKTHAEAVFSCAMKNLIGCVSGTDKRIIHNDIAANIAVLNERLPIHLNIVDGMIAMEGNGPGDGHPRYMGILIAGTDSFWVDAVICRLIGFDPINIPYWAYYKTRRKIPEADMTKLRKIKPVCSILAAPQRSIIARLLDHPALAVVRDKTRFLHSSYFIRSLLYCLGWIQDVYSQSDAHIEKMVFNPTRCQRCRRCEVICPMQAPPRDTRHNPDTCLRCLYCYWVCPNEAVAIQGQLGYIAEHRRRFAARLHPLRKQMDNSKH